MSISKQNEILFYIAALAILSLLHSVVTTDVLKCLNKARWLVLNMNVWWCPLAAKWWLPHKRGQALSPSLTDWIVSPLWAAALSYNDASPSHWTCVSQSLAIKLKSTAVDQRGCQIYVWLSFCRARAGNIWTEMLSVMWQSFTTGFTLSSQDNSGPEIWSRWRTPEYFTVDLVFNFQPSSLKSVQITTKKKSLFTSHQTTICEVLMRRDSYWVTDAQSCECYYVLSWPSEEVLSFLHNVLWSGCKWTAFNTVPSLLNLRWPLLWNVFF